ncbi:tandem-95 repeat protein [Gramella sp. BOM4]|nr:tandem-95 repeat protein [Christiangramia bathymodioli]
MKKLLYLSLILIALGCSTEEEPAPPKEQAEMPVATEDNLTAVENQELSIEIAGLLENDTRIDNARITDFDTQTSEGGRVEDNRDGTLSYFPPADFIGKDTFSYTLCVPGDSDRCSTALVTINVGDAGSPVAVDDSYQTEEDKTYTIGNHLENDDLVDNATLTEVGEAANGTVTRNEDGSLTYTPDTGFSGEDSFTYTICDDDETPNCSTATITINVIDEGNPSASDDSIVISNTSTGFTITNLLDNDVVVDGSLIVSLDDAQTSGTVVISEDGTAVVYTPVSGYKGQDTFTYTLCDDDADASCATATVTVNVVEPVSFNIPTYLQSYYSGVAFSQDPALLYDALSDFVTVTHTNRLDYYERHDYLYDADEDLDNPDNVILMYSGESRPEDEYWEGSTQDAWETFNTEHIYPQSRLDSEEAKNDMHHMRSADIEINEMRSNYPYTNGSGDYKLINGDSFFPGEDWRGDVARMVMYVNLRYEEDFETVGGLELFLEWNREDPVSDFEIQRNNVIQGAQGNRNPFIDNPYLATIIWGGDAAENRWE